MSKLCCTDRNDVAIPKIIIIIIIIIIIVIIIIKMKIKQMKKNWKQGKAEQNTTTTLQQCGLWTNI